MTRVRGRRIARAAFFLFTWIGLTVTIVCLVAGAPGIGVPVGAATLLLGTAGWIVGPSQPQSPPRRPTTLAGYADWRVEAEVARFNAEISAYEAEQRSQP